MKMKYKNLVFEKNGDVFKVIHRKTNEACGCIKKFKRKSNDRWFFVPDANCGYAMSVLADILHFMGQLK